MKFICYFYTLALFFMEDQKRKVWGSSDRNDVELEHLSINLDPTECMKFLDAIFAKSLQYNYVDNKYHKAMIEANERNCQLQFKKLNEMEKHPHNIMTKKLLDLERSDPAKHSKRNKRFVNMLSNFIRTENIQIPGRLMPLIFASKRFGVSSKMKEGKAIEVETGNRVTSRELELHITEHHGAITTTQSIAHSVLMKGTDDRMAQLMLERGNKSANGNTISDSVGGMSSTRWIAFIIFLLFIIFTMFLTAMITIYKNRGKDGCDRQTFVKRECDDNCPLMNYSRMSPDIERGWTSSSTHLMTPKLQEKSSVSSLQWPNIIRPRDEKLEVDNPKKSTIIMRDKQEQTHKTVKKGKSKVKRAKVKNVKTKKRKKYEAKAQRIPDEMTVAGRIINSLRRNKHECKCCDCDEGEDGEMFTDEDRGKEDEIFNVKKLCSSPRDAFTETDETPRKLEKLRQFIEGTKKSLNKTGQIKSRSPRLSFPMACTNKDCSARRLSVDYEDARGGHFK